MVTQDMLRVKVCLEIFESNCYNDTLRHKQRRLPVSFPLVFDLAQSMMYSDCFTTSPCFGVLTIIYCLELRNSTTCTLIKHETFKADLLQLQSFMSACSRKSVDDLHCFTRCSL